jgi:XRE family transcriptional regulator of biofilm formation
MENQKTFGERIRKLREQQNISLRELAKKVGITAGYLSQLERNITLAGLPSEENIIKMAKALNTDETELILLAGKLPSDMTDMLKENMRNGTIKKEQVFELLRSVKK